MTAQTPERLLLHGEEHSLCTEPLNTWFILSGYRKRFEDFMSSLWRGYVGTWEILDGRLYLREFEARLEEGGAVSMEDLFPGYPDRVFAHWYTGTLRVPMGRQLQYVHMGYGSTYERDLLLRVEQGRVVAERVRENGVAADPRAPAGYGVAGFTIFPRRRGARGGEQ